MEGGAVHFVDDLHARAVEEERNDDVGEAFLRGDVEGSLAPLTASAGGGGWWPHGVLQVDFGASRDQRLDNVSRLGFMQRSPIVVLRPRMHVRSVLKENAHDVNVAVGRREVEGRPFRLPQ